MNVDIFTGILKSEFNKALAVVPEQVSAAQFLQIIDSVSREEPYPFLSTTPAIAEFAGERRPGIIGQSIYTVANKHFDASFYVLNDDIRDDKIGGYVAKAQELAQKANNYRYAKAFAALADADATLGFDGTNVIAGAHAVGTGDNELVVNATTTGTDYRMFAMYTGGALKPVIWQNREAPFLDTDAGSVDSRKTKKTMYWIDLYGNIAFGQWWNIIELTINGLPTVADMQTAIRAIQLAFRTFQDGSAAYVHDATAFNSGNLVFVVEPSLESIIRQVLENTLINNNSNELVSAGSYITTQAVTEAL